MSLFQQQAPPCHLQPIFFLLGVSDHLDSPQNTLMSTRMYVFSSLRTNQSPNRDGIAASTLKRSTGTWIASLAFRPLPSTLIAVTRRVAAGVRDYWIASTGSVHLTRTNATWKKAPLQLCKALPCGILPING